MSSCIHRHPRGTSREQQDRTTVSGWVHYSSKGGSAVLVWAEAILVEVSSPVDLTVHNKPDLTRNITILNLKLVTCCGICCLLPQNKDTHRLLNVVAMEFYPRIIVCSSYT